MTLALTLHQIGVPCEVYEAVADPQPIGVGINLQPDAVRELYDLGFGEEMLDTIGIQAREWALVGRNGNDVYAEPRGLLAGYRWPQYAVHRASHEALRAYDDKLCTDISALVLRNRGAAPFGILALVDERCGGVFDDIDEVIPASEREAFMARYKAAAGFAIETLNAAPPTIARGARVHAA